MDLGVEVVQLAGPETLYDVTDTGDGADSWKWPESW